MPDGFTGTAQSGLDTAAYDLAVRYAFRASLVFDKMADVKSTNQSHNGATVTFTLMNDLAVVTTPLAETTDVSAVAVTDAPITVTLAEYGNTVVTTALLRGTSFVPFDATVANRISFNAAQTIDAVAMAPLVAGSRTNKLDVSGATAGVGTAGPNLNAATLRQAYTRLASANVPKADGGYYWAVIHPKQSFDLRAETGPGSWRIPQEYNGPSGGIINGEVGQFEGFRVVETTMIGAAGTGDATKYSAVVGGRECLAKAWSRSDGYGPDPRTVSVDTLDRLQRFRYIGWKHLVGYALFREEASVLVITKSSADA